VTTIGTSCVVFACVFGGALVGLLLGAVLPKHHLSSETKEVVTLATGMVGTLAALVLGLLVASAKGSYDTQSGEVTQLAANLVLLDRMLAHYGPETQQARALLQRASGRVIDQLWSTGPVQADPRAAGGEALFDVVQSLSPSNDVQRTIQSQVVNLAVSIGQARWLLFEQHGSSLSKPLLIVVVFWLTAIFLSFGVFAPSNATTVIALFIATLSVSGAIYLVLELDRPFGGLIQISDAPMRRAVAQLGQ
jgi:hypothetical protein